MQTQEMGLSARNRFSGKITSIKKDGVMAEVCLKCDGGQVVAVITASSAERLGLAEGQEAQAVVKATDVMVGRA